MIKTLIKKIAPKFVLDWYHLSLSFLGALIYGFPSYHGKLPSVNKKMKVIGVTGTNGKTTVIDFTTRILEEAGFKVASFSSIRLRIEGKEEKNMYKMTMPGRFVMQRFLKRAYKAGCEYVLLEVTSEGIKQHRHKLINFNSAIFTNLTPEHIESHGSLENYLEAKLKLFKLLKKDSISVVNLDDPSSEKFIEHSRGKVYGYTFDKEREDLDLVKGELKEYGSSGINFSVNNKEFHLDLLGTFNANNSLAAISFALSQGVSLDICDKALRKVKAVSGRMNVFKGEGFSVVVDYAHTPDALEKVYSSLSFTNRKICVLGSAGGGRDKWKRKLMGEIAGNNCEKIILTNEDPYDEDPQKIIDEVSEGTQGKEEKIIDRKEAIKKAISLAQEGDVVVVTGKGSEPWMCLEKGKKIPWDDREIVKEFLNKK
jgi:UDP-N-acetylmuramoyl-L-alanyl-D-glutamate--2,6-diaminopimelate ligase